MHITKMSPLRVTRTLQALGFPTATLVNDWNEMEDASIQITDNVHVQVGDYYAIVVKHLDNETFEFLETRLRVDQIIEDLKNVFATLA